MAASPDVSTAGWTGPLAELVAALETGTVSASAVDLRDLIAQVRATNVDLDGAAVAFAQVARAVELKTRALLPEPVVDPEPAAEEDAEVEAAQLAERVAAYRAFAEAAQALRTFEQRQRSRYGRPPAEGLPDKPPTPIPQGEAGGETLERLLEAFAKVWERATPRSGEVRRDRFTVAQRVVTLRQQLAGAGGLEFSTLFAADADRLEIVVTFLALLELVRLGEAHVEQGTPFGPVRIATAAPRGGRRR